MANFANLDSGLAEEDCIREAVQTDAKLEGVTLGGTGKETGDRHPKIGQGALIGASTRILGNIKIGEGAMVAAGSLVYKDIPSHSMVAGVPAKVVGYVEGQHPSLTMKHDVAKGFCQHVAASSIDRRSSVPNDDAEITEC